MPMTDGWKYDLAVTFKDGKCTGIYAADERSRQLIDVTEEVRELLLGRGTIEDKDGEE